MRWQLIIFVELPFLPIQLYSEPIIETVARLHTVWRMHACINFINVLQHYTAFSMATSCAVINQSLIYGFLADHDFFLLSLLLNMINPPEVRFRHSVSLLFLHTHSLTHTCTGGYRGTSIGSPAYLLSICLQAIDRVALFIREWDSWFPWLCPINTFLSLLLGASEIKKSHVFDRADKKATCHRESRRGCIVLCQRLTRKPATNPELIAWGHIKDLIITETIFTGLSHDLMVLWFHNSNCLGITQLDALI